MPLAFITEDTETYGIEWKFNLPRLWYATIAIMYAAFIAVIYAAFRSVSLLAVEAIILGAFFLGFLFIMAMLHPMHYGRRRFTPGELIIIPGYFGIRGGTGRYLFFSLSRTVLESQGGNTMTFSHIRAAIPSSNGKMVEAGWSWFGSTLSIRFSGESGSASIMEARRNATSAM